mmetsp:Transcript_17534/g.35080  ORF Transcript_17534/g.35080 Transcript_17534/m.35080 type:complete len:89 (-) Transcript_17534:65-331(-)
MDGRSRGGGGASDDGVYDGAGRVWSVANLNSLFVTQDAPPEHELNLARENGGRGRGEERGKGEACVGDRGGEREEEGVLCRRPSLVQH